MLYEYEIQKEGYKAKICVDIGTFNYSSLSYRISRLEILPKGKRKWVTIGEAIRNEHSYRALDFDGRSNYAKEKYLEYVTWEDICAAVDYAYGQIKPEYNKLDFRVI